MEIRHRPPDGRAAAARREDGPSTLGPLLADPFRRSRRRRWWVWSLVLLLVLSGAVALALSGEETPTLYGEDLREQAATISRKSRTFQDLVARISSVDRVELDEVVDDLLTTLRDVADSAEVVDPPAELAGPLAVFRIAIDAWSVGAAGFRDELLRAADDPFAVGIEDGLTGALLELRAGDRLYQRFISELATSGLDQPVSSMPDVTFLPQPYPIVPAAQTMAGLARADGSLLELRATLLIEYVTTEPEWILDTEDTLVVSATESLDVRVVVANNGNSPADPRRLDLALTGSEGAIQETFLEVPELDPGSKTTVTFEDLAVTPGRSYQLSLGLELGVGEGLTDENSRTVRFRVNEPTTTSTESG